MRGLDEAERAVFANVRNATRPRPTEAEHQAIHRLLERGALTATMCRRCFQPHLTITITALGLAIESLDNAARGMGLP